MHLRQRVAFRLYEDKRQKPAAGFDGNKQNMIRDAGAERKLCRVQIQDPMVDVIQDNPRVRRAAADASDPG